MADSTDALSSPTATATKGKNEFLFPISKVPKMVYLIFLKVQNVKLN